MTAPLDPSGSVHATPGFDFIRLTDTHGCGIWYYWLRISHGSITDNPGVVIYSMLLDMLWSMYLTGVALIIWIVKWVISFSWLSVIAAPIETIGQAVDAMTSKVSAAGTFLVITALVTGLRMLRGKFADGFVDAATSFLIAALALGLLHNPVEKVVGPTGYIMQAHNWGVEIAAGLTSKGDTTTDPAAAQQQIVSTMVDTFIRAPHQIINYGHMIDGTPCEQAYTESNTAGKAEIDFYAGKDLNNNPVNACDSAAADTANNASYQSVISMLFLSPAALLLMLFAGALTGALILGAAQAGFSSVKLLVTTITGQLPGSGKSAFFRCLAELAIECVFVLFALVFLSGYLMCINAVFSGKSSDGTTVPVMMRFLLVDAVMIIGIGLFIHHRRRLRKSTDRLAQTLATRPGASPARMPSRGQFNPMTAYAAMRGAAFGAGVIAPVGRRLVGGGLRVGRGLGTAKRAVDTTAVLGAGGVYGAGRLGMSAVRAAGRRLPTRTPSATRGTHTPAGGEVPLSTPPTHRSGGYRPREIAATAVSAATVPAAESRARTLARLGRAVVIDERGAPVRGTLRRIDTPTARTAPRALGAGPRALPGPDLADQG